MEEYQYPIYNENGELIVNPDLSLGYLQKEILIHHTNYTPAVTHKWITAIYFKDNTSVFPKEGDPHITYENGEFAYNFLPGEPAKEIRGKLITDIVDVPEQLAKDEFETIYRYILYTEQQLEDRTFLDETPDRLDDMEETDNDIVETLAEILGDDTMENRITENEESIEDIILMLAEIVGGDEEEEEEPLE